jgi:hypothetical protein
MYGTLMFGPLSATSGRQQTAAFGQLGPQSPRMNLMTTLAFARLLVVVLFSTYLVDASAGQPISRSAAVALAQKFVAENGYTDIPKGEVKEKLDPESIEWNGSRKEVLASRFNTLRRLAIGIKDGAKSNTDGWSVAFDYVAGGASSKNCRVVTMDRDGANIRMQHVDGIRSYFAGFD